MMEDRMNKELEMLSAYLDGELSDKENESILALIQAEPELNAALENLRKTRTLLRQTPLVKAPRNFTLTLEMVTNRSAVGRLFGTMRFVSAMAMILFAVVVVGDLLTNNGRDSFVSTAMSSADSAEMGGAEVMEMAEQAPEAAMTGANDDATGADLADDALKVDESAPDASGDAADEPAEEAMQTPTVLGTSPAEESTAQDSDADVGNTTPKISGTATVEIEQMLITPPVTEASGENFDAEQERANLPPIEPELADGDGEEVGVGGGAVEKGSQPFTPLVFRLVEVGLLLLAVGSGMVALAMRRKGSGN